MSTVTVSQSFHAVPIGCQALFLLAFPLFPCATGVNGKISHGDLAEAGPYGNILLPYTFSKPQCTEQPCENSKIFCGGIDRPGIDSRRDRLESAESEPDQTAVKSTRSFDVAFKEFRLKNGLRVILAEDHSAPTYSICLTYNVGSRDERPGRTGFAHLFEHMLFQGSENVGKGEHFILVQNNGGSANGTTNADRTNYFETLPANQLELGIFLEADRMRALNITQANLDNQRQTVQEERRQNFDNRPYGKPTRR